MSGYYYNLNAQKTRRICLRVVMKITQTGFPHQKHLYEQFTNGALIDMVPHRTTYWGPLSVS